MERNKMLHEIIDESNKMVYALKFSSKENLEKLQNGSLYLNNFQFFKDLELKEEQKGQGDAHDVAVRIFDAEITFKNPETGEVMLEGKAASMKLEDNTFNKMHLFCMTAITPEQLKVNMIDDKGVAHTDLILSDELKQKALENFGDHVMLINIGLFIDRVEQICKDKGILVFRNKINYRDMSINHLDRMNSFSEGTVDFFFQKDNFFEYQNEYRLLFPELQSETPEIIDIGSIEEFTKIIPTKDFLEGEMQFKIQLENKNS